MIRLESFQLKIMILFAAMFLLVLMVENRENERRLEQAHALEAAEEEILGQLTHVMANSPDSTVQEVLGNFQMLRVRRQQHSGEGEIREDYLATGLFVLGLALIFLITYSVARPIRLLTTHLVEMDFRNPKILVIKTGGAIRKMVNAYNSMTSQLKHYQSKLVKAEKEAAWKGIVRVLAHEIKNPLTPIRLSAENLLFQDHSPEVKSTVETILEETTRLEGMITQFHQYGRNPEPQMAESDVVEILQQAAQKFKPKLEVNFELCFDEWVKNCDQQLITQAFINLFKNSLEAGSNQVAVTLDETGLLQIRDFGEGLKSESEEVLFDPTYTTKSHGTGLGLPIVKQIFEIHGAAFSLKNHPEGGALVTIQWPRTDGKIES